MTDRPTTPDRPCRRDGVRVEVDEAGSALVRGTTQLATLNDPALAVWELCDGRTTVEEIVTAIGVLFDADPATLQRDVAATLGRFRSLGVIV